MKVGIIGGSGLYDLEGLEDVRTEVVQTPFGAPSDAFVHGRLAGCEVYFLPRHGKGHRILPSEINHRANIHALKSLGVERVISVSAVGSLKEDLRPRDIVLPDQYFDRTKQSLSHTFFGGGVVAHVSFADPACPELRAQIADAARKTIDSEPGSPDIRVSDEGTYVNMEGPAFSTRAESNAYRQMHFDVIGMTSLPEAKLCREAELCYQAMAMVTDYDCWKESEEEVSIEMIVGHLLANVALARKILGRLLPALPTTRGCACGCALKNAILTNREAISAEARERLKLIIGRYA